MDNFDFENKKKKKLRREPIYIVLCLICLVAGSLGGYFYRGLSNETIKKNQDDTFSQIAQIIESDFLDTTNSEVPLKDRMIAGMISGLGDIHSTYLSDAQAQEFGTRINGSFVGIGVTFTAIDAGGLILSVYKNTPAAQAGVLAGDMITHVQGTSVAGYTSDKIKNVIQGEKGTEVTLNVLRNGQAKELKVIRNSVETSVHYEIRNVGNQKVGYLCITTFGETTASLVEEGLKEFETQKVQTIVIDLRDNGGGYLEAAKSILDLFLPEGEILVQVEPKQGEKEISKATQRHKYTFDKGFIMVNEDSASASEVMTAALKEMMGYFTVGNKTYGKGTAQTQKTLSDSSVIKYTNAKWLTPKGVWVNGEGIAVDYQVDVTTIGDFHIGEMKKSYKYNEVDDNIKYMQEMLKELGYQVDRTDGYFSKKTEETLKDFEKAYALKIDGVYDKNDSHILLSALAYHVYQKLEDKVYQKVEELIK